MGLIRCILKHKQAELNLNDVSGRFHIARDFVPPPISLRPNLATGSSANRMDGATLIGTKAENRQWSFGVHVTGDSEAEVRGGISILDSFLRRGTPNDPVYVHVRGSEDVGFEPLWGQYGSDLRYEIVFGTAAASRQYSFGFIREGELPECQVNLQIKPFAIGLQQRLASAIGGVLEDHIGADDGLSRGIIIPEATTNQITNPIFDHATWDNDWTDAPQTKATKNKDEAFITHGHSSAKLISWGVSNQFYQTINLGKTATFVLSCYAKKQDSSEVTMSDIQIYYFDEPKTTTYTLIGNGWYRLSASFTSVVSDALCGVSIGGARTVYVDGFQLEEKAYLTSSANGDMMGCSWSGTAHDSSSSRTASRVRISTADVIDVAEGTIRVVWKTAFPNTHPNDMYIWSSGASSLRAYFKASDDKFYLTDDTNTISSAAQTFSAEDILVLDFMWSSAGLKIYKNGSEIASGGSYYPPTLGTYLYIGTDDAAANHANGIFMDFATFAIEMSATEVGDDYANILEHVEDNRRLSPVPWLWTKDGDDVVDNCDDSTRDNYIVIGGVPGSIEADTEFRIKMDITANLAGFWFAKSHLPYEKFAYPTEQWYLELQGTVSATCSGGEYQQDTITTPTVIDTLEVAWPEDFRGQIAYFGRISADAADSAKITPVFYFGGVVSHIAGDEKTIALTADFKWFYLGSMHVEYPDFVKDEDKYTSWGLYVNDVDGSVTFRSDFLMAVNGEVLFVDGFIQNPTQYFVLSKHHAYRTFDTDKLREYFPTKGNRIELIPDRYNFLWVFMADNTEEHDITDTTTFRSIKIVPRWSLL